MGRPEDKYVKLPAIIHATRIGYRYRSIKSDASGIDSSSRFAQYLSASTVSQLTPTRPITL